MPGQRFVVASRAVARAVLAAFAVAAPAVAQSPALASRYLFVWTGDAARKVSDFLVVLDADPASKAYGHVVASLPVGASGTMPHHTEYEFPDDGILLANGWAANQTFVFDLRTPTSPRLANTFSSVGTYSFPHSFARLPNGHLLGTFQGTNKAYAPPGGLVELDEHGKFVRSASAAGMGITDTLAWPYSLAIDARHNRAIVTNTSMPLPKWGHPPAGSWRKSRADSVTTSQVQIWNTSDLKLLNTISLPKPPGRSKFADSAANLFPAEPRMLPDGSVYVNTFHCGLFHITGIEGTAPRATFVRSFPIATEKYCSVPAMVGHYWIQTDMALPGLIALDISNPDKPVEVSRLVLESRFMMPHWLASDARGSRVVLTGDDMGYVLIVDVDPRTGKLSIDQKFRDERTGVVGVNLNGRTWTHGAVKDAFVHGTLFGPK